MNRIVVTRLEPMDSEYQIGEVLEVSFQRDDIVYFENKHFGLFMSQVSKCDNISIVDALKLMRRGMLLRSKSSNFVYTIERTDIMHIFEDGIKVKANLKLDELEGEWELCFTK